jgi:hypothetical protein
MRIFSLPTSLSGTFLMFSISLFFIFYKRPILKQTKKRTFLTKEESEKKKFNDWFYLDTVNSNIEPNLYLEETWKKMDIHSQETIWKTRILYDFGLKGNIIMFYDLYRQAFAYYSDTHISYPILNICAMKYVRIFSCRDFFIDTLYLPKDFISPFLLLKEQEEKLELEMKKNKKKNLGVHFDSSAFVSKKNSSKIETKIEQKNTFRYLGKISNQPLLLQSIPKPIRSQNPELFNYNMFKNLKKSSSFFPNSFST